MVVKRSAPHICREARASKGQVSQSPPRDPSESEGATTSQQHRPEDGTLALDLVGIRTGHRPVRALPSSGSCTGTAVVKCGLLEPMLEAASPLQLGLPCLHYSCEQRSQHEVHVCSISTRSVWELT